ncbi:MAG: shikimate kinase [Chlamydiota bacterium]|nr:shikimate kinase [Chlamydiota bacterium]
MNLSKSLTPFAKRIFIIGTSGCGKTFLGRKLAHLLKVKFIDLDDIYWLPNWKKRPNDEFCELVQKEVAGESWIISGNYSKTHHNIWPQADLIIWIDLPIYLCLWRGLKRSLSRILSREKCCNGNYESLRRLLGKDSILLWIGKTHSRRRRTYQNYFTSNQHSKTLLHLTSAHQVSKFLDNLPKIS